MTSYEVKDDEPMDVKSDLKEWRKDSYLEYLLQTPMNTRLHRTCRGAITTTTLDATGPSLLRDLMREGFLSAPVVGGFNGKQFITFIDMLDIVTHIASIFTGQSGKSAWSSFFNEKQEWSRTTVQQILSSRATKAWWSYRSPATCYETQSTFHAMEIMNHDKEHRIAVLNNPIDRDLVNIFTQSMVISELRQRTHLVATLLDKKVSEFAHFFKKVVTIQDTDKAINGFKKMKREKITGLAVVTEDGKLDGALTITDLKGLGCDMEHMNMLFKPVSEFKAHVRKHIDSIAPRAHYSNKVPPVVPVTVSPDDTIQTLLEKMDDGNLHRVFVCTADSIKDGAPVCTDVITQTDLIDIIMKHYAFSPISV